MADADVQITAGSGTKVDTRTVGAGTDEHRQVVVIGDPTTAANVQAITANGEAVIGGNVAHDGVDSGNPVKIGGRGSNNQGAFAASGDRVDSWFMLDGAQVVQLVDSVNGVLQVLDNATFDGHDPALGGLYANSRGLVFNGSTWDRMRGDTANGLDVDVTRLPAPHNVGIVQIHKAVDVSSATTTNIWTPASGKKIAITSLQIGTGGTVAGLVTVWFAASGDTTVNVGTDLIVFRGVLTPTANATPGVVMQFPVPVMSGTVDHLLKVTTGAATTLYVTAWGYEV
jgi:hypothetical protein